MSLAQLLKSYFSVDKAHPCSNGEFFLRRRPQLWPISRPLSTAHKRKLMKPGPLGGLLKAVVEKALPSVVTAAGTSSGGSAGDAIADKLGSLVSQALEAEG